MPAITSLMFSLVQGTTSLLRKTDSEAINSNKKDLWSVSVKKKRPESTAVGRLMFVAQNESAPGNMHTGARINKTKLQEQ